MLSYQERASGCLRLGTISVLFHPLAWGATQEQGKSQSYHKFRKSV